MTLRNLRIGARLGLGFGVIFLLASVLLAVAMWSTAQSRESLLRTLGQASARQDEAEEMRSALLASAIAVRNMGLQTQVEAVQRDQDEAKAERARFVASRLKLAAQAGSADERALFERLGRIDEEMDAHFKEAVDLASQFNTEQAGAVITGKIDPLLKQANGELARFIGLQRERTATATAQANAENRATEWGIAAAGAGVLGIAVFLAWRLTASVTQPLRNAIDAAACIARGDLSASIIVTGRDEAAGLLLALSGMRDNLSRMVRDVRSGSLAIEGASGEIAQGNSDLSSRTESQASALQQTAASVEQLTATVKQNAQNAAQAQELSRGAAEQVHLGHAVVNQVIGTMGAISEHSRKIGEITSVINGIAFQTNILALNAAVEAARAGEHGRGFAVVAAEVRSLSQRSTQAAKEIDTLIRSALECTQSGADLVGSAGKTMDDVKVSVQKVAHIVSEISAASREQTSGIEQVNVAIANIDRTTQQNAALVEEAAAAAESLSEQTHRLSSLVSAFEL